MQPGQKFEMQSIPEKGSDILLSICILSCNQPLEVERLLNSLAPQIVDQVEIIVRDDSTNNDTEYLVARFSKSIPIRYFHGTKEGIDKTVIFLINEAQGKFVWWMGDDDIVLGGVENVLEVIRCHDDLSFIWANYRLVDDEHLAINLAEDGFFLNRDELLELGGAGLGFVSATIFKRSLALPGIDSSTKYLGSLFVNLYLVLYVISQPGKHYYIHGPIVICHPPTNKTIKAIVETRSNTEIINGGFEVYGVNFPNIVREFPVAFSPRAMRRTIKICFGQTWRGMLVAWVGGWDTPKGKRIRMLKYYWTFPECWIAFIFFLIPLPINKLLYRLYKVFYSNRRLKFGMG